MLAILKDARAGNRSKWLFCLAALALLAAPVPPPLTAGGAITNLPLPAEPASVPTLAPASLQPLEVQAELPVAPAAGIERSTPKPIAASAFTVNGVLELDTAIDYGDYAWNDEGVAPGPVTIVVDLRAQRLYVYRGGIEIGRSSILYGADDKPTPTGIFPILQKKRHHISNLYGAPMPYMMRLTMDGVAIHASDVEEGYATHGCVGVPMEFAALLFAEAKMGDKVLVTDAWKPEIYWKQGAWADDETA